MKYWRDAKYGIAFGKLGFRPAPRGTRCDRPVGPTGEKEPCGGRLLVTEDEWYCLREGIGALHQSTLDALEKKDVPVYGVHLLTP